VNEPTLVQTVVALDPSMELMKVVVTTVDRSRYAERK
jgi:hypothetical protein